MDFSKGGLMKSKPSEGLIGQHVAELSEQFGNLTVGFREGSHLNIFNPWSVEGGTLSEFIDKASQGIDESRDKITFRFEDRLSITVNMAEEFWKGPEALTLHLKGGIVIVWN